MPVFDFLKEKDRDEENSKRLEQIPIGTILPNPNQPRVTFDDAGIAELAQSIRQVGLIQPLVVRRIGGGGYELVAGERRLRACKSLGLREVSCIVQNEVQQEASAMMALIENLQREDLYFLEEAQCYYALLTSFNLTQEELAQRLGKSQSSIANKLRVLRLSPSVKEAMQQASFTERHARALLKLSDEKQQLEVIRKASAKGLSVKDTEKLVEKTLDKLYDEKADGAKPRPMIIRMVKDYRLFMNTVNAAINQLREAGMRVEVEQDDTANGVDIRIHIAR
ncbi:MAG: ParB/RepB/Spo0J family partition protein [Christensenellaceae bacterium]|jgi:ParB family chromosome partitioning protein|nr:ParB/RepB/Spo0J family partition protein [Christensenellaceae bacterium]